MTIAGEQGSLLRTKYDFQWEILDIIVRGRSSLDTAQGFQIRTVDDADRFVRSYGYDLENPIERAEAFGNFHESLNFIRRYFLQPENPDGLKLEIPRKILELSDVRDLFVMASDASSDSQRSDHGNWACSILKVMHTVAHVDQDLRTSYYADVQKQIFDRFYRHIHRDDDGKLYIGERHDDPNRVNLVAFETKPKKSRDSTLLKLLHKPENVAEDIFDRVGIRFVTETKLGALMVIKYLRDKMIVMPPNIKPSRSRNTLVDLDGFKRTMDEMLKRLDQGELDEPTLISSVEASLLNSYSPSGENPHSSEFYRAIQFTARQLIKLRNPLYADLKELKSKAKGAALPEELFKLVEKIDLKYLQKEVRFFYPFEVQLVDEKSFEENEKGRSAHSEYKKAQISTALKRVLGPLAVQPSG